MEWRARVKQCGTERINAVLEEVGLLDRKHTSFSTFSLGMKQRLAIAGALLCSPHILVLDEPTNGLDPAGIAEIRTLIKRLNQQGCTVILALDEVEKLSSHVAIMRKGELLTQGPVGEIWRGETIWELDAQNREALFTALKNHPLVAMVQEEIPFRVTLRNDALIEDLNRSLMLDNIVLTHLPRRKASLVENGALDYRISTCGLCHGQFALRVYVFCPAAEENRAAGSLRSDSLWAKIISTLHGPVALLLLFHWPFFDHESHK